MELLCNPGVRHIFSDKFWYNNDAKLVPEKVFSSSRRREVKNLLGQVLNHYRTGTNLKISVGRQDLTVNALLLNFCKFD